jgi:hypothetical protein
MRRILRSATKIWSRALILMWTRTGAVTGRRATRLLSNASQQGQGACLRNKLHQSMARSAITTAVKL